MFQTLFSIVIFLLFVIAEQSINESATLVNMGRKGQVVAEVKSKFKCKKCEFTTPRKDKLKTHIESKHYQNKVKCPECPAEFIRPYFLEVHRRNCHPKHRWKKLCNAVTMFAERILIWQKVFENRKNSLVLMEYNTK